MKKEETKDEILRKVRRILQTPEGADIIEHAWKIMQEVEIARGDPAIERVLKEIRESHSKDL